jgi:hypothetical protein
MSLLAGSPRRCPDCRCAAHHALKDGTDINTAKEAYVCMTPGCGCTRLADNMPDVEGIARRNHAWHFTKKAWER